MMKKVVIAVLVVSLLGTAGTAMARGCRRHRGGCYDDGIGNCLQPELSNGRDLRQGRHPDCIGGMDGMRDRYASNMPEDIRAKANELAKLRIDLRDALSRSPIDRAAAIRLHDRAMQLEQEIETWFFGERMNRIEEFRRQQERNRSAAPTPSKPAAANP